MERNVGQKDKTIRIITGSSMIAVGAILLITAATGFCTLYKLFGISTCEKKEEKRKLKAVS
jgi:hypothetical protein